MEVEGLALTGNVLLVMGYTKIMAWLLTEEGMVDCNPDDRRADYSDSIWAVSLLEWNLYTPMFLVESQTGIIKSDENTLHIYYTITEPFRAPLCSINPWYNLRDILRGQYYLCY